MRLLFGSAIPNTKRLVPTGRLLWAWIRLYPAAEVEAGVVIAVGFELPPQATASRVIAMTVPDTLACSGHARRLLPIPLTFLLLQRVRAPQGRHRIGVHRK